MKLLSCDPNRIRGMSERMIISHYENNYGGAVKRLNLIEDLVAARSKAHQSMGFRPLPHHGWWHAHSRARYV
jgi:hypothetical protein